LSAISGLVLYLIRVRFIAASFFGECEISHLDPKDVWHWPKDAGSRKYFSLHPAPDVDRHAFSLSIYWQRVLDRPRECLHNPVYAEI
jgi:hypothetical protein